MAICAVKALHEQSSVIPTNVSITAMIRDSIGIAYWGANLVNVAPLACFLFFNQHIKSNYNLS